MHNNILIVATVALTAVGVACTEKTNDPTGSSKETGVEGNELLAEWTGPHGGVPAFDKMDLAELKPATPRPGSWSRPHRPS